MHKNLYSVRSSSEEWTLAETNEYRYDLAGISVIGAHKILARLGISSAIVSFEQALRELGITVAAESVLSTGIYIKDIRTVYYRNISKHGRPDMREKSYILFCCRNVKYRKI